MHPLVNAFKAEFSSEQEQKLFNPPATEAEIVHFKQKVTEWQLPPLSEAFYDFFRWHNGSRYEDHQLVDFHDGESILPLSTIISDKEMWDDHENKDVFKEYEPGTWWNKAWIPFLYVPDWWIGVIDTKGCFGGKSGQILCFDFKSGEGKTIRHESFEKWLETMFAFKKANLLHPAPEEETGYLTVEEEKTKDRISKEVNKVFPFVVDIWKYRRKSQPENPHWNTLEQALENQEIEIAKSLITSGKMGLNEQNLYILERPTPLLLALNLKEFAFAKWLIAEGADLQLTDCYGYDVFDKIQQAYAQEKTFNVREYIGLLIEKQYQPKNYLSLHWLAATAQSAVGFEDVQTLDFCLLHGLDINRVFPNYVFKTLLHYVIEQKGNLSMAQALIDRGIDKGLKNKEGKTALELYQEVYRMNVEFQKSIFQWAGQFMKTTDFFENRPTWVWLLSL